ncbi:MAG: ATP-binding protein [Candidatus Symbiothrix sp.]|jgi:hypothetical protein|nr:ATP-binding protein [Candidatus Symbiothrix sp.]
MSKIDIIPQSFRKKFNDNPDLEAVTRSTIREFSLILQLNEKSFFSEYTDHGIKHVEDVLNCSLKLIEKTTFNKLSTKDIAVLIMSAVLHDIAMQLPISTFKKMLMGEYDSVLNRFFDDKTWFSLWKDYILETKHYSSYQKKNYFGDESYIIKNIDAYNILEYAKNDSDRKFIGEFIRRNHPRIAHEIALHGLKAEEDIEFGRDIKNKKIKDIIGLIARSHGMEIRETFEYLEKTFSKDAAYSPYDIKIVYLMAVLRIADSLQIDNNRTFFDITTKVKTFTSPYSYNEHKLHEAIDIKYGSDTNDKECIVFQCDPENTYTYIRLKELIHNIQYELDMSWAVLGEVYGIENSYKLKYRRIKSNITSKDFIESIGYVPHKISFKFNNKLAKLLIAPLYGNNPSYGIRELLQNAIDACLERSEIEKKNGNSNYEPKISVIIENNDDKCFFRINDNGKGMTLNEIINYFLTIGTSYQSDFNWKKLTNESDIYRAGRFGIGVLAAFLLGKEISINTKSMHEQYRYTFNTTLETDLIKIHKEKELNNNNTGTIISIEVDIEQVNKLKYIKQWDKLPSYYIYGNENNTQRANETKTDQIEWFEWYPFNRPNIDYYFNNEKINPIKSFRKEDLVLLEHTYKELGIVFWFSTPLTEDLNMDNSTSLFCNGILINRKILPKNFNIDTLMYNNLPLYKVPHLWLHDKNNTLPISLDREKIDINFNRNSFWQELHSSVVKDFIAKLLTLDSFDFIDTVNNFSRIFTGYDEQKVFFLFSDEGFCLTTNYCLNVLKNKYKQVFLLSIPSANYKINNLQKLSKKYPGHIFLQLKSNDIYEINDNYTWGKRHVKSFYSEKSKKLEEIEKIITEEENQHIKIKKLFSTIESIDNNINKISKENGCTKKTTQLTLKYNNQYKKILEEINAIIEEINVIIEKINIAYTKDNMNYIRSSEYKKSKDLLKNLMGKYSKILSNSDISYDEKSHFEIQYNGIKKICYTIGNVNKSSRYFDNICEMYKKEGFVYVRNNKYEESKHLLKGMMAEYSKIAHIEASYSIVQYDLTTFDNSIETNKSTIDSLFKLYFGDDIIIPYDLEKRKIKFSKAFEELSAYTKRYLEKILLD